MKILGVLLKSVTETCDDMMTLFERGKKRMEHFEHSPTVTDFLLEISLYQLKQFCSSASLVKYAYLNSFLSKLGFSGKGRDINQQGSTDPSERTEMQTSKLLSSSWSAAIKASAEALSLINTCPCFILDLQSSNKLSSLLMLVLMFCVCGSRQPLDSANGRWKMWAETRFRWGGEMERRKGWNNEGRQI